MKGPLSRIVVGVLICIVALAEITAVAAKETPQRVFSFAVVPQQAPSKLLKSWAPMLQYLQARTGYRFVFRTAPDIPSFEDRIRRGEYDFAYMNPYHFTVFNQGDAGFQAVAKARDKQIQGILVVRKDSSIETLSDLEGQELAFPAPAAFAASVLPRASLTAEGIRFTQKYVSSHDSVYRAVANGLYPAGGGVVRTLKATDPEVQERLRVLWMTPGYTPHAIAANPKVPTEIVAAVQQALVGMSEDEAGRAALQRLKLKGLVAASNSDWDDVRRLNIRTSLGSKD